jgi:hypothetical protein
VLRVHLSDGRTLTFNLFSDSDARSWKAFEERNARLITGLSVTHNGVTFAVPQPCGFGDVDLFAYADKTAEVVTAHAGAAFVSVTVHGGQRAARVDVVRAERRASLSRAE